MGTQRLQSVVLDETRIRATEFAENRRKRERVRRCTASPVVAVPSSSEKDTLGSSLGVYGMLLFVPEPAIPNASYTNLRLWTWAAQQRFKETISISVERLWGVAGEVLDLVQVELQGL
ncbi:hypothetical protein AAC387_Pa03g2607 [Persea americana]